MSSTTNLQSLLPNTFRPVYTWNASTQSYSISFNLSNIDTISTGSLSASRLIIGDSNLNVYVGNNSGNASSNALNTITYYNTGIGVSAGAGISNVSNSVFVGYLAGSSGRFVYNSFIGGANAGLNLSNISNCVMIGSSNSSNLSNISNTVSVGTGGAGGSWGVYLGTNSGLSMTNSSNIVIGSSSGLAITGSNNLLIGNSLCPTLSNAITGASVSSNIVTVTTTGLTNAVLPGQVVRISGLTPSGFNGVTTILSVGSGTFTYSNTTIGPITGTSGTVTSGIPSFSFGDPNALTTCNVLPSISNKLFIGSGSNILIGGDFSTGLVTIGTTNTTGNTNYTPFNTQTGVGNLLALDVGNYVRIQKGLSIGRDPGEFSLDVNGQMRVSDGYGQLVLSNNYNSVLNASVVEMRPVSGGTLTLAASGYTSKQTTTAAFGNGSTSNIFTLPSPGMVTVNVRNATGVMYSAPFLVSNATTGTFTFALTPLSNAALTYSVSVINGGVTISNASGGSVVFTYNVMFYPC
jgi:hypothetical protein